MVAIIMRFFALCNSMSCVVSVFSRQKLNFYTQLYIYLKNIPNNESRYSGKKSFQDFNFLLKKYAVCEIVKFINSRSEHKRTSLTFLAQNLFKKVYIQSPL